MRLILFLLASTLLFQKLSFAQSVDLKDRVKVDPKKNVSVSYASPSWNKNSQEAEYGYIILRDAVTAKIAKIKLAETDINTNLFSGTFQLPWKDQEVVVPEIYFLTNEFIENPSLFKQINEMISDGRLLRKPYFFYLDIKNEQKINIFDSKEQAYEAFEQFRKLNSGKNIVETGAQEANRNKELLDDEKKWLKLAQDLELERIQLQLAEKQKQNALIAQQKALDEAELKAKKDKAQQSAQKAMSFYQNSQFIEAEKLFSEAYELDPENSTYYYQYGVSLYRNQRYNKAIVILRLISDKEKNIEKDYYIALSHLKLKEYESARLAFENIKKTNDKNLAPSSAFYVGVIKFQKEQYLEAKEEFQFVLDKSNDPKLDQESESYIEQIANVLAFKEEQARRWRLSAYFGAMYDSNINTVATINTSSFPSGIDGYRALYGLTAEYKFVYERDKEFSGQLSFSDMYSVNKQLKADSTLQNADPQSFNLSFPLKWKGTFFSKPGQLSLIPSYESIFLNIDQAGARENAIQTAGLKTEQTLVVSESRYSIYSLDLKNDRALYEVTSESQDANATRAALFTSQIFFQDNKKTKAWIADGGITINQAKGADNRYQKIELACTYLQPWIWNASWSAKLGLFNQRYPQHTSGRSDTEYDLTLSVSKPLTSKLILSTSAMYMANTSTNQLYDYRKYTVSTVLSWSGLF